MAHVAHVAHMAHMAPPLHALPQVLQRCGLTSVPEVGSVEEYLESGPGFIFLFHPALGPLWDVVAQKIRGGFLAKVGHHAGQLLPCLCCHASCTSTSVG